MEYLATDVTNSLYYSVKAKILKAICLAQLGYINESYMMLLKVSQEKDLPLSYMKPTEFSLKEIGYNFSPSQTPYINENSPFDEKNREPIENIMKLEV
mmetsp:Transcript_8678/g.7629  ORF Transcript_8678/g.7629 Transcript_8678/m.7629 type:complete len:98 (+) Transcript_8678:157-450(+)